MPTKWWAHRMAAVLPLASLALLLALYALDLQDLVGKLFWLGPSDAFAFHAERTQTFHERPLVWGASLNSSELTPGAEMQRESSWTSFYERCDALYPVGDPDSGFFHTVRATNCQLGSTSKPYRAPEILFTASVRVDSIAWTSCRLLQFNRRPPLCQENLVTQFPQRYRPQERPVTRDQVVPVHSEAEVELLRMLDLISHSYPLSAVVSGQGFQSSAGVGVFTPVIFICGSPSVFQSAVVGFHAPGFGIAHRDLGWLTVDRVNVLGLELVTRQNVQTVYTQRIVGGASEDDEEIVVIESTTANFSSFGHLYVLIVVGDVLLFWLHVRSAAETHRAFELWCLLGDPASHRRSDQPFGCWTMLYRSFYRSPRVVALTMLSGVLSWLLILPHSIIWTWSDASLGKPFALVTTVRVWMLVACCLTLLWNSIVSDAESRAYAFAKRSFVSLTEIMAITLVIVSVERHRVFSVSATKYAMDGQRKMDSRSFANYTAFANAYNEDLDGFGSTPPSLLLAIFAPLFTVVWESTALVMVCAVVKYVANGQRRSETRSEAVNPAMVAAADDDDTELLLAASEDDADDGDANETKPYHRLPLEEMVGEPVRANALVRNRLELELRSGGQIYLLPEVYFDAGVLVKSQSVRTRDGFARMIRQRLDVRKFFPLSSSSVMTADSSSFGSYASSDAGSSRIAKLLLDTDAASFASTSAPGLPTGEAKESAVATPSATSPSSPPPSPPKNLLHSAHQIRAMRRRKSTTELATLH